MAKDIEQIEKVNNENKMEVVKLEERISNLNKDKAEIVKTIEALGIPMDEAVLALESSEEEYAKLIKDANIKLGVE